MNLGRQPGPVARWLLQPTQWIARLCPILFALIILSQACFFLPVDLTVFMIALVWLAIAGPYLFWSALRWLVRLVYDQSPEFLLPDIKARRRIGNYALIFAAIAFSNLAVVLPFSIIKPSLDVYANHLFTEMPMLTPPGLLEHRVGIYNLRNVRIGPEGVFMSVNCRDVIYRPGGHPLEGGVYLVHLAGDWYTIDYSSLFESPWPHLY
jgi:hypothetical protein